MTPSTSTEYLRIKEYMYTCIYGRHLIEPDRDIYYKYIQLYSKYLLVAKFSTHARVNLHTSFVNKKQHRVNHPPVDHRDPAAANT